MAGQTEKKIVRGLCLVTTEAPPDPTLVRCAPFRATVHLPSPEVECNAAALLTARYPGRVILLGRADAAAHTFLDLLARHDFRLYASVPEDLEFLLPEAARPLDVRAALERPCCAWLHVREALAPDTIAALQDIAREIPTAFVPLTPRPTASPRDETRFFIEARFSHAFPDTAALLDLFPSMGAWLQAPLHLGDGSNLAWEASAPDRAFFGEDWRRGLVRVTQGGTTLLCGVGAHRAPPLARELLWLLGRWRTPSCRTIWDARERIEAAARARLTPLRWCTSGDASARAQSVPALLALLDAHMGRYARAADAEVMGRLKDLGYL